MGFDFGLGALGGVLGGTLLPGVGILPGAMLGGFAGDILGEVTGSRAAQEAQERAQRNAMGAYQQGLGNALGAYDRYYSNALGALSPYQQTGGAALSDYYRLLGANTDADLRARRDEMMSGINSRLGARGNFYSSGRAKALGAAEAGYQNAREQRMFDRLGFLSGLGANAAGQQAGLAQGFGNAIGGAYQHTAGQLGGAHQGIGQAQAAGATAPFQNALGLAGVGAQGLSAYSQYQASQRPRGG